MSVDDDNDVEHLRDDDEKASQTHGDDEDHHEIISSRDKFLPTVDTNVNLVGVKYPKHSANNFQVTNSFHLNSLQGLGSDRCSNL